MFDFYETSHFLLKYKIKSPYSTCTGPLQKLFHYAIFQKFFHIF